MATRNDRLYNAWLNAKARCNNPNNPRYSQYGGRGIRMHEEWIHNYEAFKSWALTYGYAPNLTLDRIDVNGNYTPSNCRWITNNEQQNNKRCNRVITYKGVSKTITEWARSQGLEIKTLEGRLDGGWSVEKAIETKVTPRLEDLTGRVFGRLTVLSLSPDHEKTYWLCRCSCGKEKTIRADSLKSGAIVSCGCYHKEKARIVMSQIMKRR